MRSLFVHSTTPAAVSFNVTVCSGPTSPPSCTGSRPQCTVSIGSTVCANMVNAVTVAQGDYVEMRITGQGDATGSLGFAVEIADP